MPLGYMPGEIFGEFCLFTVKGLAAVPYSNTVPAFRAFNLPDVPIYDKRE